VVQMWLRGRFHEAASRLSCGADPASHTARGGPGCDLLDAPAGYPVTGVSRLGHPPNGLYVSRRISSMSCALLYEAQPDEGVGEVFLGGFEEALRIT